MTGRGPTSRRLIAAAALVAIGPLTGCATTVVTSQSLALMDRAREAPAVKEGAALAPQELQLAEAERKEAQAAEARHDEAAADLYAERARVAYERTVVLARLARATTAGEAARLSLAKQAEDAQHLAAARAEFDRAADVTATELAVAREALVPAHIGPADASREQARALAARSLAAEGHLLCGAARLLVRRAAGEAAAAESAETARVDAATRELEAVETALRTGGPRAAPQLDAAAKSRAACLDALTRVRRTAGEASTGDADALLAALSARGGWDPSRDERGVVVTLRGAFKGTALVADAERQLRELGRVAAAHANYPVQIVVHDAVAPGESERYADAARGKLAAAALAAPEVATSVETVGASLPTTDPAEPRNRGRNARLEVVFVSRTD